MKAIGKTPLIKLERLSESGCADIYVKYEGANPTGSMKDRMALSMIEGADSGLSISREICINFEKCNLPFSFSRLLTSIFRLKFLLQFHSLYRSGIFRPFYIPSP